MDYNVFHLWLVDVTNLFGGPKYTTGFPSDPSSTTVSFRIILLLAKRIFDGANILLSPFVFLPCFLRYSISVRKLMLVGVTANKKCMLKWL